ncbi:MAG TPA: DUF1326 domain-containing protein [Armatimonadota bacterium]|jgi:hypothetical protein
MLLQRFQPRIAARSVLLTIASLVAAAPGGRAAKSPFNVAGQYVEGCSCPIACPCDMTGLMNGCEGMNAIQLSSGRFHGVSLAGARIAFATTPGKWVRGYVDARNPRQSAAAKAFARSAFAMFGKVEFVKDASIRFQGRNGRYNVSVNGGKTMLLSTSPVLGADRKTAISHANITDPLNHTLYQGKVVSGHYDDGEKRISLKGSNSYFNSRMRSSGRV